MSIINSQPLIGAAGQSTGYKIERSLRFNSADSAYLNRTPASAGNRKTFTWSGWVKRSALGSSNSRQIFLQSDDNATANSFTNIFFDNENFIRMLSYNAGAKVLDRQCTPIYRDVSAWYHIVIAFDMTQTVATNRQRVYVNNVEITDWTNTTTLAQNSDTWINYNQAHYIGREPYLSNYANWYLTEVNFIDGQQLTPSSFGETDTDTGVWKPKAYSGSYGTNGFYLKFADNSGTTSTTLGKDSSGNGNNWTPNNFSVTAGAGNDSLVDTPTPYGTDTGAGGEVRGNYATLNPVDLSGSSTLSNGNLDVVMPGPQSTTASGTIGVSSGKWYWEVLVNTDYAAMIGIANAGVVASSRGYQTANGWYYYDSGSIYNNNTATAYGNSYTSGDIIGVALDMDNGKVYWSKNGTWQNSGNPATGTNPGYSTGLTGKVIVPCLNTATGTANTNNLTNNFGARPFAYTAPSGFKALCTQNLPTPTIGATSTTQASYYFTPTTYAGNSTTAHVITGFNFQPDLVWQKSQNQVNNHHLTDAVRGVNKDLLSNSTSNEATYTDGVTSFNSNGFTVGNQSSEMNVSGINYAVWAWKANGAGSTSHTQGSISSTASANTTSGFSIVTYTGTGSAGTIGHGLGVAPKMIIVKSRDQGTTGYTGNWYVYHASNTSAPETDYLLLNSDAATADDTFWNDTAPTSTVFSVGALSGTNDTSDKFVAYCFAPVASYSSFGSFVGNGSSDGPFIYTGFRPAWILIRPSDAVDNWQIQDIARNPYNVANNQLWPNLADAEQVGSTSRLIDFVSNGFKIRGTNTGINSNAVNYIYAAFAENPFKYSLAR